MTVVVIGDVHVDVVAAHDAPLARGSDTPARTQLRGGGGGGNVAAWLAEAGAGVALVGAWGTISSRTSRWQASTASTCAWPARPASAPESASSWSARTPSARCCPMPVRTTGLQSGDLPEDLFAAGNVLYVSGYTLLRERSRPAAQAALARAHEAGMPIALDAASAVPLAQAPDFMTHAGRVDLLFANAAEAAVLGDGHVAGELVIKRGAGGAAWTDGERRSNFPPSPPTRATRTGAGDAFAAGFLSAWPGPPDSALERALALAAVAVTRSGARP